MAFQRANHPANITMYAVVALLQINTTRMEALIPLKPYSANYPLKRQPILFSLNLKGKWELGVRPACTDKVLSGWR